MGCPLNEIDDCELVTENDKLRAEFRRLKEDNDLLAAALLPEGVDVVHRVTTRYIDWRDNKRTETLVVLRGEGCDNVEMSEQIEKIGEGDGEYIYCPACSEAGEAGKPVFHTPPACSPF